MIGVYYLTDGLDVLYVGASRNVERRIKQHTSTIDFSQVFVDQCDVERLRELETAAIKEYHPPLNEQNARG